jgi:hypothetical protein
VKNYHAGEGESHVDRVEKNVLRIDERRRDYS